MKNIIMLVIAVALYSCQRQEKSEIDKISAKDTLELITRQLDSIENKKDLKKFTTGQKNKIIGDIKFGDSKKVFEKKIAEFVKKSKKKDSRILIENEPSIGNYNFSEFGMLDLYINDKLYYLRILGLPTPLENYNSVIPEQLDALKNVIAQEYGEPEFEHEITDRLEIKKGYQYIIYGWDVGRKRIEIQVVERNYSYFVDLLIYDLGTERQIEKRVQTNKLKNTVDAKGSL